VQNLVLVHVPNGSAKLHSVVEQRLVVESLAVARGDQRVKRAVCAVLHRDVDDAVAHERAHVVGDEGRAHHAAEQVGLAQRRLLL